MIFNHKVKYNGVYYPAGVDVPMEESKPVETVPKKVATEEKKEIFDSPKKTPLKRKTAKK